MKRKEDVIQIYDFVDEGLSQSSSLIEISDAAAQVDPPRFPKAHESLATRIPMETS